MVFFYLATRSEYFSHLCTPDAITLLVIGATELRVKEVENCAFLRLNMTPFVRLFGQTTLLVSTRQRENTNGKQALSTSSIVECLYTFECSVPGRSLCAAAACLLGPAPRTHRERQGDRASGVKRAEIMILQARNVRCILTDKTGNWGKICCILNVR